MKRGRRHLVLLRRAVMRLRLVSVRAVTALAIPRRSDCRLGSSLSKRVTHCAVCIHRLAETFLCLRRSMLDIAMLLVACAAAFGRGLVKGGVG